MRSKLDPKNLIRYGDGEYWCVPVVIKKALDTMPPFLFHSLTGLSAQITLCEPCADTLDWTRQTKKGDIEHNWNGDFRVQYGEDQYLEGHYFRDYPETPIHIGVCLACGAKDTTGHSYRLDVDEIDYGSDTTYEIEIGTRVSVLGMTGKVTGWTDGRPAKRRYHVQFAKGFNGTFMNWQLKKVRTTEKA